MGPNAARLQWSNRRNLVFWSKAAQALSTTPSKGVAFCRLDPGSSAVCIISGAIRTPVAIGVTVLLISLFGLLALKELPLQLFPDIERPTIAIFTNWRGASPEEVEAELLEPQEQVLQGLAGVEEVNGNANSDRQSG